MQRFQDVTCSLCSSQEAFACLQTPTRMEFGIAKLQPGGLTHVYTSRPPFRERSFRRKSDLIASCHQADSLTTEQCARSSSDRPESKLIRATFQAD